MKSSNYANFDYARLSLNLSLKHPKLAEYIERLQKTDSPAERKAILAALEESNRGLITQMAVDVAERGGDFDDACQSARLCKESAEAAAEKFARADIVYATGGSLKFLTENWSEKGVFEAADAALKRGAVLMGFSSGAMCWADKGWDDTEPETFRIIHHGPFVGMGPGFAYYDCAGLLPFCLTPHYDSIGWRSYTYEAEKADYPSVCIENGAALVYEGGRYSVLSDAKTPTRSVFLFWPARGIKFVNLRQDASLAAVVDGEIRSGRANG